MSTVWTATLTMYAAECPTCGIAYGVPEDFRRRRQEDGVSWYCPRGHKVCYLKSDVQGLRDELARERHRLDQVRAEANHQRDMRGAAERSLSATKGVVTRIRNRVGKGVCPCCNRTFQDLGRHMATKHPAWAAHREGDER